MGRVSRLLGRWDRREFIGYFLGQTNRILSEAANSFFFRWFSFLSNNITFFINPILESVRVLALLSSS